MIERGARGDGKGTNESLGSGRVMGNASLDRTARAVSVCRECIFGVTGSFAFGLKGERNKILVFHVCSSCDVMLACWSIASVRLDMWRSRDDGRQKLDSVLNGELRSGPRLQMKKLLDAESLSPGKNQATQQIDSASPIPHPGNNSCDPCHESEVSALECLMRGGVRSLWPLTRSGATH